MELELSLGELNSLSIALGQYVTKIRDVCGGIGVMVEIADEADEVIERMAKIKAEYLDF